VKRARLREYCRGRCAHEHVESALSPGPCRTVQRRVCGSTGPVSAVGAKPMAGRGSAWHTDGCGAVSGQIRYGALIQKRLDRSEDCVWWRDEIPYDRAALSTIYAVRRRDTSLGAFDKAERCTHNRSDNSLNFSFLKYNSQLSRRIVRQGRSRWCTVVTAPLCIM